MDKGTVIDLKVSIGPAAVTYKCAENITAPTEDSEYQPGMNVTVIMTTADGTQLINTQTTSFPIEVVRTGLKSATGTVQFTFTVTTPASLATDPNTGEQITVEGTSTEKTVTREVTFTAE